MHATSRALLAAQEALARAKEALTLAERAHLTAEAELSTSKNAIVSAAAAFAQVTNDEGITSRKTTRCCLYL